MTEDSCTEEWMAHEESVKEKVDESGFKWRKVYLGGGTHLSNWLDQFKEIYGEENIQTEEIGSGGLACFERSGEKLIRIWAKTNQ